MNWKKRKKRREIMEHYGLKTYEEYKLIVAIRVQAQYFRENNVFPDEHMIMSIATNWVCAKFRKRRMKKRYGKEWTEVLL